MSLTESLVRTKLSTSIEMVAPSLGFSSAFFPFAMLMFSRRSVFSDGSRSLGALMEGTVKGF